MSRLISFLEGEYKSGEKMREEYLIMGIASIHCFYLVIFFILNFWVLTVINLLSLLTYTFCMAPKVRSNYYLLSIAITAEVLMHMICAIVCIGWNYGFELFFVMLVPALYYIKYCAALSGQPPIRAWIGGIFCACIFVILKIYTYGSEPLYTLSLEMGMLMSVFNGLTSFGIVLYLMSTFIGAINVSEKRLKEKNEKLNNMANLDPLTELYNRRGLEHFISKVMYGAENLDCRFCLIMSDIDDFKQINDTYGHACGDYVLKQVAETIKEYTRHNDCICRWGGEEILILLNSCDYSMAMRVAEKLRKRIEEIEMEYNEEKIKFTMTFGLEEYRSGMSFEELVAKADEKLYIGKSNGKNRVV